jgi:hypothetical protein
MSFFTKAKLEIYPPCEKYPNELIKKININIEAPYLSHPGSNPDFNIFVNEIQENLHNENYLEYEEMNKQEIKIFIEKTNEILYDKSYLKNYNIKYAYAFINHRTKTNFMKVTLKENHKLIPIELFYLHALAYHKQDGDNIDEYLLYNGDIEIKIYSDYIVFKCDTDS